MIKQSDSELFKSCKHLPVKVGLLPNTWKSFSKSVRKKSLPMLSAVHEMTNLIFVSGCQRSGTTALTNVMMNSEDVIDYRTKMDSELLGALILCGSVQLKHSNLLKCFQTTYLNERYFEYFDHIGKFKLIFIIRNPFSVCFSMMYNWKPKRRVSNFALNELYTYCGRKEYRIELNELFSAYINIRYPTLKKAVFSYVAKTNQAIILKKRLGDDCLLLDYDDIISNKEKILPQIFLFFNLKYNDFYQNYLNTNSQKKSENLSINEKNIIREVCYPSYEKVKRYCTSMI